MPVSVTSQWINAAGLGLLFLASGAIFVFDVNGLVSAFLCMAAYATPIILLENCILKTHRRPATGLDWSLVDSRTPNTTRVRVKLIGLLGSIAAIAFVHWLFRLYDLDQMAMAGFAAALVAPVFILLAIPYFACIDRAMIQPEDGYWHFGRLLLGRYENIDWRHVKSHALSWTIKGFFLPIMFVYLIGTIIRLKSHLSWLTTDYVMAVRFLADYAAMLELSIVCVGYTFTCRVLDSHIRSPNPLLGAWLVTLVCYAPFNRLVTHDILRYDTGHYWYDWFGDIPLVAIPWSIALLMSFGVWIWATASFGMRWSNLTNRGIVTNGPYRFTKHPDYISKSIFFWLINVPFLSVEGPSAALKTSLMLVCVNLIYYGRAKAEEKHLSQDPDYVAYAEAIRERGIFRFLHRPFLPNRSVPLHRKS